MAKDTNYVSDTTKFISSLFDKDPALHHKQDQLRSTWWDKGFIDQEEKADFKQSEVKRDGYAYYSYPSHAKN
ncbi:MAG: DUF3460 family protein [Burkholderiales bacterium]|jgi:hypothetical protein